MVDFCYLSDSEKTLKIQFFTKIKSLLVIGFFAMSQSAQARPALQDVPEIDDNMLAIAIAYEISKECDHFEAKKFKGLTFLLNLKSKAQKMGYTDDEVRAYVKSDEQKGRLRRRGETYLQSKGFDPFSQAGLCSAGFVEVENKSLIGSFLRKN